METVFFGRSQSSILPREIFSKQRHLRYKRIHLFAIHWVGVINVALATSRGPRLACATFKTHAFVWNARSHFTHIARNPSGAVLFKGQRIARHVRAHNVGAYSAAWDRAFAQRIPRVSLTRAAAIAKITPLDPDAAAATAAAAAPRRTAVPLAGKPGTSGVGMRGIRPCASAEHTRV